MATGLIYHMYIIYCLHVYLQYQRELFDWSDHNMKRVLVDSSYFTMENGGLYVRMDLDRKRLILLADN